MESFADLKSKLEAPVREFFDFVWRHYLKTGRWPTARVILAKWDKAQMDQMLTALSGALLIETENGGSMTYELRLLGILCTADGEEYLGLLGRYLGFLRDIFFNRQEKDSVSQDDAKKTLDLKPTEVAMLGRLIFSGFLPSSGTHSPDFATWQVSLPKPLEDLPRIGPLDGSLARILDEAAQSPLKVRLRDRIAGLASIQDPMADPALKEPGLDGADAPVVFISYSHDTREHKIWVLELARRLRSHGIDVRLDQWDLAFGADVPKFMERNVTEAGRVLMVCTEPYVRKVDEGKGGVGYEAMIVTAELIRDLGTTKFIPVIRQDAGKTELPKCIGNRYAVNLSVGSDVDEEFSKLVDQLRQTPPPSKPPLGGGSPRREQRAQRQPPIAAFSDDPGVAYREALSIAGASDLASWRKLVAAKKSAVIPQINLWRESVNKKGGQPFPKDEAEMPGFVGSAIQAYGPVMAVATAGVESTQPKFNQQGSLIYDLLEAPGWERTGSTIVVTMPEAAVFTFQAILGAMAVLSGQNGLICDLAMLRISEPMRNRESGPLYAQHHLIGWPRSFDAKCIPAWRYLLGLPDTFPWIAQAFGSPTVFRECLCGHYLVLSWIEFLDFLRAGNVIDPSQGLRFDVPTLFFRPSECSGGVRRVLDDRAPLLAFSEKHGVDAARQVAAWPDWVKTGLRWISWVYNNAVFDRTDHEALSHFAEDLFR
jgi:hypothetical protein